MIGGAGVGIGAVGETLGPLTGHYEFNVGGTAALLVGGFVVADALKTTKERIGWLREDQARSAQLQTHLYLEE